jgi:hypothetical protein
MRAMKIEIHRMELTYYLDHSYWKFIQFRHLGRLFLRPPIPSPKTAQRPCAFLSNILEKQIIVKDRNKLIKIADTDMDYDDILNCEGLRGLSVNYESLSKLSFFSKVLIFICNFSSILYEILHQKKKKKVLLIPV